MELPALLCIGIEEFLELRASGDVPSLVLLSTTGGRRRKSIYMILVHEFLRAKIKCSLSSYHILLDGPISLTGGHVLKCKFKHSTTTWTCHRFRFETWGTTLSTLPVLVRGALPCVALCIKPPLEPCRRGVECATPHARLGGREKVQSPLRIWSGQALRPGRDIAGAEARLILATLAAWLKPCPDARPGPTGFAAHSVPSG